MQYTTYGTCSGHTPHEMNQVYIVGTSSSAFILRSQAILWHVVVSIVLFHKMENMKEAGSLSKPPSPMPSNPYKPDCRPAPITPLTCDNMVISVHHPKEFNTHTNQLKSRPHRHLTKA